ncbi:TIM44-like domain-containing protein [Niveibacterium umoris]|uniref:Putative lipid-binding transport protein (Tim44 family) n=1 Tax=Niveibacterium umoris TaxID=1193620 RepID=A0A840BS99_9RHOO|nr:Tim44-like domain-containing protein [Niveibacterium umoris]MBB4013706.1 putative lipid-binding transport protein (Tim44 family) [Niveibacterium umoris]
MKRLMIAVFAIFIGSAMVVADAEAKRLGGSRSIGMQRTPAAAPARPATPPQAAPQPAPASAAKPGMTPPAAQPSGWRKWAGPLAGLAAGIGLAALLSHFGVGADFAGILLAMLAAGVVFMLIRRFMAGKASQSTQSMQYAGAGAPYNAQSDRPTVTAIGGGVAPQAAEAVANTLPAGFDAEGFARNAKVQFVRLQAANDAGNLEDIREFTTPEMFAEFKLDIDERRGAANQTDVIQLDADVLEVVEEGSRYIASVRFHGLLREAKDAPPAGFNEVWHLTKPVAGNGGWVLAGIQQVA